jgi:transaldolase
MHVNMDDNPLKKLELLGQAIWLDYIRRDLMDSGKLRRLIHEDGLSGITSNPSIFQKAIAESQIYDQDIHNMTAAKKDITAIYESLSQTDVKNAADELMPVFERTAGKNGYVSLEVNPHLAYDASGTVDEARRLWKALNKSNVFIKVPATIECLPAIRQLISEGININVTLIFGLPRYRQVTEAYIAGLEDRLAGGGSLKGIASVASFFLSRIDTLADPMINKYMTDGSKREIAGMLRGQVAISSAKVAYQMYRQIFVSSRFRNLAAKGAAPQRLLWASTGTKNPEYSDVKYVESVIGRDTVNTLPPETLDAFRDHGKPKQTLEENTEDAYRALLLLRELDIDIDLLTNQLEDEGIAKFNEPFDKLLDSIARKSKQ